MILGINASRARSGGAKAHLIGILSKGDPPSQDFAQVHVWSYRELLDALPDRPWLIKHCPRETEGTIFRQIWWERFQLPTELRAAGCSILFNVDAGSVCRFRPAVTLSQDLLAYEPGEMKRLGFSKSRLRQILLRYIQCASLRYADGAIFLTQYAADTIQNVCGELKRKVVIPHGVNDIFRGVHSYRFWAGNNHESINCLYVSPIWPFKHQWHVIRALDHLRKQQYNIHLTLVGDSHPLGLSLLEREIQLTDPNGVFVKRSGPVRHQELIGYLNKADIYVFASSCECLPITLLEGMAAGLPIACSNRGPMPETLQDGGVYFDPEDSDSIANAIKKLVDNEQLRYMVTERAKELSSKYCWTVAAEKTYGFICETYYLVNNGK